MKKCLSYLIVAAMAFPMGCAKEPDPRDRPDFVDTGADPSKVMQTMKPTPAQGGGGGASAGAGPPPTTGS